MIGGLKKIAGKEPISGKGLCRTIAALIQRLFRKDGNKGSERLRRAGITGVTSVLAQGIGMAAGLVSIPLTVKYLGAERYGVWLTMGTAFMWLGIADLGLGGNALVNVLAEADGKDDSAAARGLVATAFWSLSLIAGVVALAFTCVFPFVSWTAVFNVSSNVVAHELGVSLVFSAAIFVLMLPLGVVSAIYRSYQEGYVGNFWEIVASIFSLLAVVVVTRFQGGLPQLVLALSGTRLVVMAANAVYLFAVRNPWLVPRPSFVSRRLFNRLLTLGVKYLVNQMALMAAFQSQPMLITHTLGPAQVGTFMIVYRLVTLPSTLVYLLTFPLLSAYAEAKARGDWNWIWGTLRKYLVGSAVCATGTVIAVGLLARSLVRAWAGPALVPEVGLVVALGTFALLQSIATPSGILLYGLEKVGGLALIQWAHGILTVLLSIRFAQSLGLVGIAIAMSISYVAANWVGQAIQIRQILNDNRKAENCAGGRL
jgi:O-antigen/teichoic acid export membrane protein